MYKRVVVCLSEDEHGNILYGKDAKTGKYSVPAGKLKKNENPIVGAIREWKEETGTEVVNLKCVSVKLNKNKILLYLFVITAWEGDLNPHNDPDKEFSELKYLDPNTIKNHLKVDIKEDVALEYYINN